MTIDYMAAPGCAEIKQKNNKSDNDIQDSLFKEVCDIFGQDAKEVIESCKSRKREYVVPRQVGMAIFRFKTKKSLAQIGRYFGRDHATVLHAIKTVKNMIDTDREYREIVAPLFEGVTWPHFKN